MAAFAALARVNALHDPAQGRHARAVFGNDARQIEGFMPPRLDMRRTQPTMQLRQVGMPHGAE